MSDNEIQTWRYSFPSENHEGWAIIFMDSIGCFSALSDWGSVSYRWPNQGWGEGDFRKFIIGLDDYYLESKFGQNRREYDPEGTLKAVQNRLDEAEKEKSMRPAVIAKERELLKRYNDLYEQYEFWEWSQHTSLNVFEEHFSVQRTERDVTNFIKRVMPRLRVRLKAELEALTIHPPAGSTEQARTT